jgi:3-phosphoglycerate kinase
MSFDKKTIDAVDVSGKRVLVRVDFNVPQDESGKITDDRRIKAALPTIKALADRGGKVVLASHLGRPKGGPEPKYSLKPVVERLSKLIDKQVPLAPDCVGPAVKSTVDAMKPGDVLLLENVRFHSEEEKNDPAFAKQLADLADVYVNDAFGTAHRAHASTEGVARVLESRGEPAVAGYLMQKELEYLGGALENPARPFVSILGGVKVKDKIAVIENLLPKVDKLLIGGAMAYTFYKANGLEIGKSILDESSLDFCRRVLKEGHGKIELPSDTVVASEFKNDADHKVVKVAEIPSDYEGVDIGPETVARYSEIIKSAKTVVWNGPMGVFEMPNFAAGTNGIAQALADATARGATTIVGGGDSAAAVEQMGFGEKMTHISTGGGASLEFLEGKELPGVAALLDA